MAAKGFSIGVAAQRSGCPVATIRYYEEVGLLRSISRAENGRRVYGWPDIERLRLVRRLRALDFGLDAIQALMKAIDEGPQSCLDVRDLALSHLDIVRAKKAELDALERSLTSLAASCTPACADGKLESCTIIEDFGRLDAQADRRP